MKVLVTGASGMMGRAVAQAFMDRGDEVTALQRRPAGLGCREVRGDITDDSVVRRAVAGQDAVVHLAAKVDVVGPWSEYEQVNIGGTRSVVDACRVAGVGRLVNVSSPSVAHSGSPLVGAAASLADPQAARSNYSRSKAVAESIALAADGPDLAVLCLRPHLVWGPGDTQLIEPVIERARSTRLIIIGSGAALIDTTYVDNAVDAFVAAVDCCGPVHGESLVVSNGEPRSVAEILRRVCTAAGVLGPRLHVPLPVAWAGGALAETIWSAARLRSRPPLTRFLVEQMGTAHWFDQRRTQEALRWTPQVSLDEGFSRLQASLTGA